MHAVHPSPEAVRLAMARIERAVAACGGDREAPMDWGIVHRHGCRTVGDAAVQDAKSDCPAFSRYSESSDPSAPSGSPVTRSSIARNAAIARSPISWVAA